MTELVVGLKPFRTVVDYSETSSADVFETGNQPYQNHCEF